MRSRVFWMGVAAAVTGLAFATDVAQACPMCKESVSVESSLPTAYMYSILFMLSMPAIVLSGFSFTIWRAFKKHDEQQQALLSLDQTLADSEDFPRPSA